MLNPTKIQRQIGSVWPRAKKHGFGLVHGLALLLLSLLFAGCTTTTSYQPNAATTPKLIAKPADYPIPVYTEDKDIPRPCELIGTITIGHTSVTVMGGSIEDEMKKIMKAAHEHGADIVQIVAVDKPGYTSPNYGVTANLLRYADQWESNSISDADFSAYLQQHQATLDPIEGVWSGGWPNRIGIIKDTSKPGRDFIAFTLVSDSPAWPHGYKKMDIARGVQPGTYDLIYYHYDFATSATTVLLNQGQSIEFISHDADNEKLVRFTKIGVPTSTH